MSVIIWFIALLTSATLAWFSWWHWKYSNSIEERLFVGDSELLDHPGTMVDEVIHAPAGSQIVSGNVQLIQQPIAKSTNIVASSDE